jgi:arylsulfatase A-like enzyme
MALNIDIAPTLLDLAGLEPSASMQGESLLPLVRGESTKWRTEFFYEHLFEHPRIPKTEGVRTEAWKYIRYVESDPAIEELYDLRRDPQELENLAGRKQWDRVLARLRRAWSDWRAKARHNRACPRSPSSSARCCSWWASASTSGPAPPASPP